MHDSHVKQGLTHVCEHSVLFHHMRKHRNRSPLMISGRTDFFSCSVLFSVPEKYFAVGFMSEKANHKFRYVWLYKVRAKPMTETYKTKEGATITRQNGSVEWTAIKRTSDGRYQAVADEGENGFDSTKAATFLQSVYEPTFTPEEDGP